MAPQEIQDDVDVRVVLCKDAISTGWDCPRAEVLVSLRRAQDQTYITQLIGRMVRTPLARRIPTDQTLNTVLTFLPYFNRTQVREIVDAFASGRNDEPVQVMTAPVRIWRNSHLPSALFDMLAELPTYVVPGRAYRTQVSRLYKFAALLTADNIVEDAINHVRLHLVACLEGQKQRLEADGTFQATLNQIRSLKIERSVALLAAESLADLPEGSDDYEMDLDPKNIEDLFKVAKRKFPEGLAQSYWNRIIDQQPENDWDPAGAKATVAALALHVEVGQDVEAAAESLVKIWLREHQKSIASLSDAHKVLYDTVRSAARGSEPTTIIVPETDVVADSTMKWPKHLLCGEDHLFPQTLREWEEQLMDIETANDDLVGWYRNPTGGKGCVRIPYRGDNHDRAMYPDFILFHQTDNGIRPSIVDPHGHHLSDARSKLRGLADYAEDHGTSYARIESVIRGDDGHLLALDMKSEVVRTAVRAANDTSVEALFIEHGGSYN